MGRTRADRILRVGEILLGRDRAHPVTVAVGLIEHRLGDIGPAFHAAGTGQIVRAVPGLGIQQVEDRVRHVPGEREAAVLVVHHRHLRQFALRDPVGQAHHGLDEVMALADHPAGTQDVMARAVRDRDVARGLRLAVHAERRERLLLVVQFARSVEHIVARHVHQGDVVLRAHTRQQGRALSVRLPRQRTPFRRLGLVDRGVRARVDDRAVQRPVEPVVLGRVGEIERVDVVELEALQAVLLHVVADGVAELAVAAGDHRAARGHGPGVPEHRVVQVRLGAFGLLQRDRPVDVQVRVGEVHEGVRPLLLEAPVRVDEVRVRGAVLERLEAVAHASRHVDRLGRVEARGVHLAEALARAQVDPRAEHRAGRDADVLVPRLGVDAAGHALLRVERDVVLHRPEVGQAQRCHLRALPVLLEPAAVVAVHRQVEHDQAGDVRPLDLQFLLKIHESHSLIDIRNVPGPPRRAVLRPPVAAGRREASLALLLVPGLGGGLRGLPPGAVLGVPLDGLLESGFEVGVRGPPAELGLQLGGVDGVAAVVPRAVPDPVERVLVLAHHLQDHAQHGDVVPLAVRADQVGLADPAPGQDGPHAAGVVLGVDPVAHVLALAVQLRADAFEDVGDLARDELLHVLVRAVVVGAVGDRGPQTVGAGPRAHQHVAGGLGGRVRAGRMVRGGLGELRRIVPREVGGRLVGAHVVVSDAVLAHGLQQAERALHVRLEERLRVRDAVVVVRLGRVMHDRVVARHDPVEQLRVADVAVHELDTVLGKARDVLDVARVGQRVEHGHVHLGMIVDHVMHEIRTDETAATGHDNVLRNKFLFAHTFILSLLLNIIYLFSFFQK